MTDAKKRPPKVVPADRAKARPDLGIDSREKPSGEDVAEHERWLQENRPPHHG